MREAFLGLLLLTACQINAGVPAASASAMATSGASAAPAVDPNAAALGQLAAAIHDAQATPTPVPTDGSLPVGLMSIAGRRIPVDIADTPDSRRQGLSGRPSLATDTGLVLAWSTPTPAQIWMPDMNFAIDVIFVAGGKVIAIYPDAQPCPAQGPCPSFGPQTPVSFVAEVPAGSAAAWGLKVGDSASFSR